MSETYTAPLHTNKRLTSPCWLTVFDPKAKKRHEVHNAVAPCGLPGIIVFTLHSKKSERAWDDDDFWTDHSFYAYALKRMMGHSVHEDEE